MSFSCICIEFLQDVLIVMECCISQRCLVPVEWSQYSMFLNHFISGSQQSFLYQFSHLGSMLIAYLFWLLKTNHTHDFQRWMSGAITWFFWSFSSSPSPPPPSGLITLAPFFLFPHSRPLMLPLTCTASMVCPLPETQVQLSMVTRSVHRQMLDTYCKHLQEKTH